jgi:hypothetical protein
MKLTFESGVAIIVGEFSSKRKRKRGRACVCVRRRGGTVLEGTGTQLLSHCRAECIKHGASLVFGAQGKTRWQ